MEANQAETIVTLTAAVSTGVYFYRKNIEGVTSEEIHSVNALETFKRAFGSGPVLPLGQWLPAAGVTFIGLAIVTAVSPEVGGSLALLIGAGTVLGNAVALQKDLSLQKQGEGVQQIEKDKEQVLQAQSAPNADASNVHPATLHSPAAPTLKVVSA